MLWRCVCWPWPWMRGCGVRNWWACGARHLVKERTRTSIIRLPESKNGQPRRVVLTQRATPHSGAPC